MYDENNGVKIKRAVWQLGLWHKLLEWAVPRPRNVAYQKNKKSHEKFLADLPLLGNRNNIFHLAKCAVNNSGLWLFEIGFFFALFSFFMFHDLFSTLVLFPSISNSNHIILDMINHCTMWF